MMLSMAAIAMVLLTCLALSCLLQRRATLRMTRATIFNTQLIEQVLTLMQLLQKHRGLGAQQNAAAAFQRERIAHDIDYNWNSLSADAPELNYLRPQWQQLKQEPANFDGHCAAIKQLLGFIEILANRSDTNTRSSLLTIAERCRSLENLARLRGLSSRAAQFTQCPIELKVPLKYLCENLQNSDLQRKHDQLKSVLTIINTQLLDTDRTSITAPQCFEMLTPILDDALDAIRSALQQISGQYAHKSKRETTVTNRRSQRSSALSSAQSPRLIHDT